MKVLLENFRLVQTHHTAVPIQCQTYMICLISSTAIPIYCNKGDKPWLTRVQGTIFITIQSLVYSNQRGSELEQWNNTTGAVSRGQKYGGLRLGAVITLISCM